MPVIALARAALTVTLAVVLVACTDRPAGEDREREQGQAVATPTDAPRGRWFDAACDVPHRLFERIKRDHFPGRSPDIITLPDEPNYFGGFVGTSHSGPWDYVQEIPIALFGPGFIRARGELDIAREVTLADIAPTMAELLDTDWPANRPGRSLSTALVPERDRGTPRLIIVVVWDGGGTNVLQQWPDAWPNLRRLMDGGSFVMDAIVGSSPSNTPPAHTNIGTGAWPNQHGIVDIKIRADDRVIDPFVGKPPSYVELSTIADLYDLAVDNAAEVGLFGYHPWHLGMLGHGSFMDGGDRDLVALVANSGERIEDAPDYFEFPEYANVPGLEDDTREIDASDGKVDSRWMGHDTLTDPFELKKTPAFILYQTRVVEEMLQREGFGRDEIADLFFVNYKPLDTIGHRFNMVEPEVESAVRYSDTELGDLTQLLDETAGKGEWVMIVTADHGQTPAALTTGAWPIKLGETMDDLAAHFEVSVGDLFDEARVGHFWMNSETLEREGIYLQEIADFWSGYRAEDNLTEGEEVPAGYEDRLDERLFTAAWPSAYTDAIARCVKG